LANDEEDAGRGILSAVVVHKHCDMEPGKGFFELAKYYRRNLADHTKCWVEELKTLYESLRAQTSRDTGRFRARGDARRPWFGASLAGPLRITLGFPMGVRP
jgi:hypothetical protein